jgi:hypothetical protein
MGGEMRRSLRDAIANKHLLERITLDIRYLILNNRDIEVSYEDIVNLWDEKKGFVKNGISYGKENEPVLEKGYGKILEEET